MSFRSIRTRVALSMAAALAAGLVATAQSPSKGPGSVPGGEWRAIAGHARLPQDSGAAGTWQKLLKLGTVASAMHTTAHPDDEHGGVLALLSRRDGVRMSLLTLNRGQSGDNAIGPQLFDGLGLIRTEELLVSDRYYGVDDQYFTTAVDYGFSKRIDEALDKWGRDNVLRDIVRIIRMDRPLILVSRFQGNQRDGHGNHQTAGLLTVEAYKAAGDPTMYPEQMAEGLRPWQPLKVYIGGMREDEAWSVKVDPGEYSPWIADSYNNFARLGLSFQRSQNSGRFTPTAGPSPGYYKRALALTPGPDREAGFFDGMDTSLPGLFTVLKKTPPAGAVEALTAIDAAVTRARAAFSMSDPSKVVPALAEGLAATRAAMKAAAAEPDAAFVLAVKERQFVDAINTALGVDLTAVAQPAGVAEPTGPFAMFAPPPAMRAPVPGQSFEVRVRFTNRSPISISPTDVTLAAATGWSVQKAAAEAFAALESNQTAARRFTVTLAPDAPISTQPYFTRKSIMEDRYTVADMSQFGRPASAPPLVAVARYTVHGQGVEARQIVVRREPKLPYGDVLREVRSVPALAVTMSPGTAIIPLAATKKQVAVQVEVLNNKDGRHTGEVALTLPAGWTSTPASQTFAFAAAGERATYAFSVSVPALESRDYAIEAVATADGRQYRQGYELIDHRDLEVRYLYRPATTEVRGVDVTVVPNLSVGYVMGVGDMVPAGIAQLGSRVTLLDEAALAKADLTSFDAIMTGTRAYAVREDLKTYNQRLLDYVKEGGNLIVLYNTQEFVPNTWAPFPAELPRNAEEVSEEDSPIEKLTPSAQAFTWPNQIGAADFQGWVEQRGSKFWSTWDAAYTPMLSTYDRGQAPQKGGWLQAKYGKGTYTYFAYAFHRQLPYGVPGAYRLLANLLALGKSAK